VDPVKGLPGMQTYRTVPDAGRDWPFSEGKVTVCSSNCADVLGIT
jgi:hypothetical protein